MEEETFTEDSNMVAGFESRRTFGVACRTPYSEWDLSDSPEVVAKLEQLAEYVREYGTSPGPYVLDGGSSYTFTFRGEKLEFDNCRSVDLPKVYHELVAIFLAWEEDHQTGIVNGT